MTDGFEKAAALTEKLLIDRMRQASKKPVIIAIDGRCGSGKTTLAAMLHERFGGNLFHMDDFFLRVSQRTPQRYSEPGGNVDYERFKEEVLEPLREGKAFAYRRFDCVRFCVEDELQQVTPQMFNIVEGSYAMHPYFGDAYDLCFFVTTDSGTQIERIRKRNGEEKLKRFINEWIPLEEAYFSAFRVEERGVKIHMD